MTKRMFLSYPCKKSESTPVSLYVVKKCLHRVFNAIEHSLSNFSGLTPWTDMAALLFIPLVESKHNKVTFRLLAARRQWQFFCISLLNKTEKRKLSFGLDKKKDVEAICLPLYASCEIQTISYVKHIRCFLLIRCKRIMVQHIIELHCTILLAILQYNMKQLHTSIAS